MRGRSGCFVDTPRHAPDWISSTSSRSSAQLGLVLRAMGRARGRGSEASASASPPERRFARAAAPRTSPAPAFSFGLSAARAEAATPAEAGKAAARRRRRASHGRGEVASVSRARFQAEERARTAMARRSSSSFTRYLLSYRSEARKLVAANLIPPSSTSAPSPFRALHLFPRRLLSLRRLFLLLFLPFVPPLSSAQRSKNEEDAQRLQPCGAFTSYPPPIPPPARRSRALLPLPLLPLLQPSAFATRHTERGTRLRGYHTSLRFHHL